MIFSAVQTGAKAGVGERYLLKRVGLAVKREDAGKVYVGRRIAVLAVWRVIFGGKPSLRFARAGLDDVDILEEDVLHPEIWYNTN